MNRPGRESSPERIEYRFADYVLVVPDLTLRRDGADIRLNRQSLEVLAYLLRNRSRVVTREELIQAFWGRSPVGADARLNTCLRRIRTALHDERSAPDLIRTHPRVGYQFSGKAEERPVGAGGPEVSTGGDRAQRRRLAFGAGAVLLAALGVLAASRHENGSAFFGPRPDSVYRNDDYRVEKFGNVSSSCNFDDTAAGACELQGDGRIRILHRSSLLGEYDVRTSQPLRCVLKDGAAACAEAR